MRHAPVIHNIPDEHDHSWRHGDLPNRNVQYAGTNQHPKSCSQKNGPEDSTPFVNEHGGRFDDRFTPLNVDRTWNVVLPAKHDEEDRVGRDCSGEEREGHECGECCEGDRERACEDEIGRIGGHENNRT